MLNFIVTVITGGKSTRTVRKITNTAELIQQTMKCRKYTAFASKTV